jgi:hypothetical protein
VEKRNYIFRKVEYAKNTALDKPYARASYG